MIDKEQNDRQRIEGWTENRMDREQNDGQRIEGWTENRMMDRE